MATDIVYDAIRAFLELNAPSIDFRFENEDVDPPKDQLFVNVELAGDIMEQESIGAGEPAENRWRESGTLLLHYVVPAGSGSREARKQARVVGDLFRGLELVPEIQFTTISTGFGDGGDHAGQFCVLPQSIAWFRHF